MSDTLTIKKERVLAAAAKCSTAKETLKEIFPEAFEDDKYFDFGEQITLDWLGNGSPFFIANKIAPIGLERKCIVVSHDFDINVTKHDGYTIIIPTRK